MITRPTAAVAAVLLLLMDAGLEGQGRAQYRDFQLGGDLASVAALAGIDQSTAKVIHARPALMQELEWRPTHWMSDSTVTQSDPIQQVSFSFYNDQLFRVVVDYDRDRTAGLTDADMIEAISLAYGPRAKPVAKKPATTGIGNELESGALISQWAGTDYAVALYRSTYSTTFRMIVTMPRLDALARTADAQALKLDAREAPQREVARQKKEADDTRTSQEKARAANKATFRP
jgi:hypothetical protein